MLMTKSSLSEVISNKNGAGCEADATATSIASFAFYWQQKLSKNTKQQVKSGHVVVLLELQIQLLEDKRLPHSVGIIKQQEDCNSLRLPRRYNVIQFCRWKASPTCGIRLGTGSWIRGIGSFPIALRKQERASPGLDHNIDGRGRRSRLHFSFLKLAITCYYFSLQGRIQEIVEVGSAFKKVPWVEAYWWCET